MKFGISLAAAITLAAFSSGCRTAAPIHVWHPPELVSVVGKCVLVGDIDGDTEIAAKLQQELLQHAPSDSGRQFVVRSAAGLAPASPFRLASAIKTNKSDLALSSVGRENDFDYVLSGKILESRGAMKSTDAGKRLAVSWRLESLRKEDLNQWHDSVMGKPVVAIDHEAIAVQPSAVEVAPGIVLKPEGDGKPAEISDELYRQVVDQTYGLLIPSVRGEQVELANSYGLLGSREVRRANALAEQGNWNAAREIWRSVVRRHPSQYAGLHNLAVAEVAAQNFTKAKQYARQSIRLMPIKSSKETLIWIELKQRAYHQAFGLPDPPEGWFFTRDR